MSKTAYSLEIYSTEDYTDFQKLKGNRELSNFQVNRLVKIIEKEPDFTKDNPLLVNEKMQVIDGQHRLQAFRLYQTKTGKTPTVYYIKREGWSIGQARSLNSGSKSWTPLDYAKAYASEGNPNYEKFIEIADEFPFSTQVISYALSKGGKLMSGGTANSLKDFKDGKFEIGDEDEVARGRKELEQLLEVVRKYGFLSSRSAGSAFIGLSRNPAYSHKRMVSQLKEYASVLHSIPDKVGEIRMALNTVYNMGEIPRVDLLAKRVFPN